MRKRYLILFSGGYDSTCLLEKHLKKGNEVIAFHIIMKHQLNNRWHHELKASRKIIKMLKDKYYDFKYIEETYDSSLYSWDSPVWASFTPNLLKHKLTKFRNVFEDGVQTESVEVQVAWNKLDMDKYNEKPMTKKASIYPYSFPGEIFRVSLMSWDNMPELKMPYVHCRKEEYRDDISDEIFKEVFICRRPLPDGTACGKCLACQDKLKQPLS